MKKYMMIFIASLTLCGTHNFLHAYDAASLISSVKSSVNKIKSFAQKPSTKIIAGTALIACCYSAGVASRFFRGLRSFITDPHGYNGSTYSFLIPSTVMYSVAAAKGLSLIIEGWKESKEENT